MSPAALGQMIAAAVGIAISPVAIAAIILLLLSPRAKTAGMGFLLGWGSGIVAAVTTFALLSAVVPVQVPGAARTALGIVELSAGVIFLVLGALQWRRRRRTAADRRETPAWMRVVDRATFPSAFAVGFVMALNPPNLLLSAAGGAAIGITELSGSERFAMIVFFTFVAALTVLAPVAWYFIAAEAVRRPLDAFRSWLTRHDATILMIVFVVLGLVSAGQGISALSSD